MVIELVVETDNEKSLAFKFVFVLLLDPETDLLNLTLMAKLLKQAGMVKKLQN